MLPLKLVEASVLPGGSEARGTRERASLLSILIFLLLLLLASLEKRLLKTFQLLREAIEAASEVPKAAAVKVQRE